MAKKALIISSSARRNSDSDILADAIMNGARNAGNESFAGSLCYGKGHLVI